MATRLPVAASQRWAGVSPSSQQQISRLLSRENARRVTGPGWDSVWQIFLPVYRSQRRATFSPSVVATILPSGDRAKAVRPVDSRTSGGGATAAGAAGFSLTAGGDGGSTRVGASLAMLLEPPADASPGASATPATSA